MEFGIIQLLKILGALGLFIFGMKIMSEGIQSVAGDKMRSVLAAMTSNRFLGILSGFFITALIQSSSATTVMVVSFVNAGLLSLTQSIGVIMGANIGTTITGWLVSILGFKISMSSVALPIIALSFPFLFSKKQSLKSWGELFIGFAILFIGLNEMKEQIPDLKNNLTVLKFIAGFKEMGIFALPIYILIGTLLTVVVQSSSAAMAITQTLANQGMIPFDMACGIIIGENVGTTITANLAAMVGNVNAKRAARAHFIFNLFGVLWIMAIFKPFLGFITYIITDIFHSPIPSADANGSIPFGMAVFHTIFNLSNVFILIWFTTLIKKIVIKLVPSMGKKDEESHLEYMGEGIISSVEEAKEEVKKFGKIVAKMNGYASELLSSDSSKDFEKYFEKIKKYEERTDELKTEISNYLAKVSELSYRATSTTGINELLSVIDDLERAADIYLRIAKSLKKHFKTYSFSENQSENLMKMSKLIDDAFLIMNENLENDNITNLGKDTAYETELKIDSLRKTYRKQNIKSIESKESSIKTGMLYYDIIASYELLGNHIYNVTKDITDDND